MKKQIVCTLAVLALVGLAAPQPARAFNLEVIAGYYFPDGLDDDVTWGVGFGNKINDRFGWEVSGSWFDVANAQGYGGQKVDADLWLVDFSFQWYPNAGGFAVYGGPGFASAEIKDLPGGAKISDDVFSIHGGVSYEALLTESFYVKPDVRVRWYQLDSTGAAGGSDSTTDWQAMVALGWRFGH